MKKILWITFMLYVLPCSYSQTASSDVISTSGSSIVAEGLIMSWTIGENIIDFYQDFSMVTGHDRSDMYLKNGILITVYPTLTREFVYIKTVTDDPVILQAELIDLKGHILKTVPLHADKVELNIGDLMYGTYILRISNPDYDDHEIVKIIKQ